MTGPNRPTLVIPSRDDAGTITCPICQVYFTPRRPADLLQHRVPQDRVPAAAPDADRGRRHPRRPAPA